MSEYASEKGKLFRRSWRRVAYLPNGKRNCRAVRDISVTAYGRCW